MFFRIAVILTFVSGAAYAKEASTLTLRDAIDKAMRSNPTLLSAELSLRSSQLTFQDAWEDMYLPQISLGFSADTAFTAFQTGSEAKALGYPNTTATLTLGKYKIFNFGRDKLAYERSQIQFERDQESYEESKRSIRFRVIEQYFRFKTELEKLRAAKRIQNLAESIVDLVKSRKSLGRASESDIDSARVDYLNTKIRFDSILKSVNSELWRLNFLIGDPIGVKYNPVTDLRYSKLNMGRDEAIRTFTAKSPSIKQSTASLKSAEIALEIEEKNRLPLPTIAINGMEFRYANEYAGSTADIGGDNSRGRAGNIDVGASIFLTIPLTGSGGWFGNRSVQRASIDLERQKIEYQRTINENRSSIYGYIDQIQTSETRITDLEQTYKASSGILDNVMGRIGKSEIDRLELRDAIDQAINTELDLKDSVLSHLSQKLQLSELIGVDRLPGESAWQE